MSQAAIGDDGEWRSWWGGTSRPYLVLTPAQFFDGALRRELERKFPGVEIVLSQRIPAQSRTSD